MNSSLLLSTEHLGIGYSLAQGKQKVIGKDLTLQLRSHQLVCLIGMNGAGKSTLMRTLCGLQKPLEGQVFLGKDPLDRLSSEEMAKRIGVVLTEKITVGHLSVETLIGLGRHPHTGWFGRLGPADEKAIEEAIQKTNLESLRHQEIGLLSDGQRQKVMIARVLAQKTPLLLLDEPTAFLDLVQRVETLLLLRDLAHDAGHGVLISTHDMELALRIADCLWVFDAHQQIHVGTPEALILSGVFQEVFNSPHLEFVQESGIFQIKKRG